MDSTRPILTEGCPCCLYYRPTAHYSSLQLRTRLGRNTMQVGVCRIGLLTGLLTTAQDKAWPKHHAGWSCRIEWRRGKFALVPTLTFLNSTCVNEIFDLGVDGVDGQRVQLPRSNTAALFFVLSSHHFIHNHETNRIVGGRSGAAADIRMHSRMIASLRYHRLLLACERPAADAASWPNVSVCYFENDITCCARHALLPPLPLHFCAAISFPVAPK